MVGQNRVFMLKNNSSVSPILRVKGSGMMPMVCQRRPLATSVGIVAGKGALLLEDHIPQDNQTLGTGFGVKSMDKKVIQKLGNLNVGRKRKNVNFEF